MARRDKGSTISRWRRPGKGLIHPQQVAKALSDFAVRGRRVQLRRRPADGLGGAVSGDERQAAADWGHSCTARWRTRWRRRSALPIRAASNRQVISLSGDGGFTMLMGDFLQPRDNSGLPVKVVVFNNGALGFIELEQKSTGFLDFRHRVQESELRRHGRGCRNSRHSALRTRPMSSRGHQGGPRPQWTGAWSTRW